MATQEHIETPQLKAIYQRFQLQVQRLNGKNRRLAGFADRLDNNRASAIKTAEKEDCSADGLVPLLDQEIQRLAMAVNDTEELIRRLEQIA